MNLYRGTVKLILAGMMVLALATPVALAKHAGHGRSQDEKSHSKAGLEEKFFGKAHMLLSHAKELGLSQEQEDKIINLKFETQKSLISKDAEIDILALTLKQSLHARTIQTDAVNQLIDQKYELKKEKTKSVVAAFANLKGLLTEEQYGKMKDLYSSKMCSHSMA